MTSKKRGGRRAHPGHGCARDRPRHPRRTRGAHRAADHRGRVGDRRAGLPGDGHPRSPRARRPTPRSPAAAGHRQAAAHRLPPRRHPGHRAGERFEPDAGPDADLDPLRTSLANLLEGLDDYADVVDPVTRAELTRGSLVQRPRRRRRRARARPEPLRPGRLVEALWWWQFSYLSTWGDRAAARCASCSRCSPTCASTSTRTSRRRRSSTRCTRSSRDAELPQRTVSPRRRPKTARSGSSASSHR